MKTTCIFRMLCSNVYVVSNNVVSDESDVLDKARTLSRKNRLLIPYVIPKEAQVNALTASCFLHINYILSCVPRVRF